MFKRNLELIQNTALKERLEKITLEESSKEMSYCMTPSNDYLLMKNDIPFDDLENPRQAIKDTLAATIKSPMGNNDIIITFGIGLGYLLDEVYNAYPSKIFVYEPDINVLHFVLNNVDISEHLASGRVFITNELDELLENLSNSYISKDKVEIVYLKNYAVIKNRELLELSQKVYETCRSKMVDVNTIAKYSKTWMFNIINNITHINNSEVYKLSDLENKFAGQTAVILAPGPSLDENIERIKANKDKFIIFAVNKVLSYLKEKDLTPHFAVFLDPEYVENTLVGLEDFCSNINCIVNFKADSKIFETKFKKIFVSFSQNDLLVNKLAEHNNIISYENGGSASVMALVTAQKLGFDRTVFSGLDLAFKKGVAYASGEQIENADGNQISIGNVSKKRVEVKSITGENVESREDYAAFIKHFETLIKDYGYKGIYNTTTFGAAIEGIRNVSFDELHFCDSTIGLPIILGEAKPFKLEAGTWVKEELMLINNVISIISKGIFSPALISAIVGTPLLYQYMLPDVLNVLQTTLKPDDAEEFISKVKVAVKDIITILQKNNLI